jgi:hypothetical protein
MKKILALVLALMLLAGCMSFAAAEEQITLNVWSFTNELEGMIANYYAPTHPNVTVNYTIYPTDGGAYTTAVDTLLAADAASAEAPDVFTLEAAFVKKYVNSDWTADLIGDLGFTEEELAVAIPVMRQIGTSNINGQLKGLSWQATPGALMYRASLAEKYLGVTSPEEMQALVADWDLFLETAAKVNEASEGATKMVVGDGDIWNAFNFGRTQGWVVDGKLVIDDVLYDFEDLVKTLYEDDLTNKGGAWTEVWFNGMKTDSTFCFFLPTWGLHYTLKPNCGLTTNDTMDDAALQAACEADGGTYGDWRMIAGPMGYSWGGTWIGANAAKVAAADDAKKAVIKDFIAFFTLSEDFLYQYAKDSGDFVGSNAVVEKILAEGGTPNPFLGGQDHYSIFAEAANLANGSIMTDYDETMNGLWRDNVTTPYSKGEVELDAAIANFKAAVAAQFPELVVE